MCKYLKNYKVMVFGAIFFLSLETFADLLQPMLISKLINNGVGNGDLNLIFHYGRLMLITTIFGLGNALMRNWLSSHVSFNFARDLREDLFKKILGLSMIQVEELESGALITRITSDVNQVQQFVNGMMRVFLKAPLLAIGSILMVMRLDLRLAKIYLVLIPVVIVIVVLQMKMGYPLYAKIQKQLDRLNIKAMEFLNGIRVVKAFNRFEQETQNFEHINENLAKSTAQTMKTMSLFGPLIGLMINLTVVVVLYMGNIWVIDASMGVGDLVAFINYMTQFLFAMAVITRVFTMSVRAKTSADRINEVFALKNDVNNKTEQKTEAVQKTEEILKPRSEEKVKIQGSIEFVNVSYHYGSGEKTIKDLSFEIKAGESVGIIGATGAGKSTLVHLIAGMLDPTEGRIMFDGIDGKQMDIKFRREFIGLVTQKTMLFSETILENLKWGRRGLADVAYHNAARVAEAEAFINLFENGYDTLLGKGGVNLSGGQKQRLSIARAIVHQPKILILDDSLSAVDVITERKIKRNLEALDMSMTMLIIAQRISSVMVLDKILVLDEGQLVGLGNHETCLAESTVYRDLYESQLGKRVVS